jgi:cysteinyl-tRNA synthetase
MKNKEIQIYNTFSREKEILKTLEENKVKFYSCGPTVYNNPHIGNYRAFIFADTLKRVLYYNGYEVKHIMNVTDVDDKTIRDSQKNNKNLKEFTEFYTQIFIKESEELNIIKPFKLTRATDYIKEMILIIEDLLGKNIAYTSADGSIYFDIKKYKDYGVLSKIKIDMQKDNASGRIKADEYDKENVEDFALWKSWDEKDGDVFWEPESILGRESVLTKGRPGWHIECSAMSMTELGESIDVHTGGIDNMFPHHENEIAQCEASTHKKFSKYWMHSEWVFVDNKKMAKSENNFFTLKDLKERNINPLSYRFWLLMAHYRTKVNLVWETIEGTENALKRLYKGFLELGEAPGEVDADYKEKFTSFVNDDLDTPKAVALVWELLKDENVSKENKKATLLDFDKVLGIGLENLQKIEIPEEVSSLAESRLKAKQEKNYALSDEIRKKINSLGYEILDTKEGFEINKL